MLKYFFCSQKSLELDRNLESHFHKKKLNTRESSSGKYLEAQAERKTETVIKIHKKRELTQRNTSADQPARLFHLRNKKDRKHRMEMRN